MTFYFGESPYILIEFKLKILIFYLYIPLETFIIFPGFALSIAY